jgi:hypothetical protein
MTVAELGIGVFDGLLLTAIWTAKGGILVWNMSCEKGCDGLTSEFGSGSDGDTFFLVVVRGMAAMFRVICMSISLHRIDMMRNIDLAETVADRPLALWAWLRGFKYHITCTRAFDDHDEPERVVFMIPDE